MTAPNTSALTIPASALPMAAQLLHQLFPATGVVHVGVGQGLGPMHTWRQWGVPRALLLDAAPDAAPWIAPALAAHAQWQHASVLVGAADQATGFYTASNPAESGILQPEALRSVWPKLSTVQQQTLPSQALDTLANATTLGWHPDWLVVDCLPALPVLQGGAALLSQFQVVWLRVALSPTLPEAAQLAAAQSFLSQHHFVPAAVAEGMHPAVGDALFVRNWPLLQQQTQESLAKQSVAQVREALAATQTIANLEADKAAIQTSLDAESNAKAQAITQRDALALERDQLFASRYSLASEKQQLITQRDALLQERDQLASNALAQAEQIKVATQTTAKLEADKAALQTSVEAESKAKEQALAQCDAVTQERDAQARLAAERQTALEAAQMSAQAAAQEAVTKLEADKAALQASVDAESKAKEQALEQRDAVTLERDAQARLATERQSALEAAQTSAQAAAQESVAKLEADKAALQARVDTESKANEQALAQCDAVTQERDAQIRLAAERQTALEATETVRQQELTTQRQRMQQLEADNRQQAIRQQMLQEELIKAEAQIELIKDLLLREPGL